MPRFVRRSRLPYLVLFLAGAYTLGLQALVPADAFVNGDSAIKFLLTRQFASGGWSSELRLPGPDWAQKLWDEERLYPIAYPNVVLREGRRHALFSVVFPALSVPSYRLFGFRGLTFLPLVACWVVWAFALKACRGLRLGGAATALVLASLAFASPLSFYSATFWEHLPGLALAFGGLVLLLAPPAPGPSVRSAFWGGLLLGLAPLLREELAPAGALVGLLACAEWLTGRQALLAGRALPALAGLLLGAAAVAGANLAVYGHALGMHAGTALATRAWTSEGRAWRALKGLAGALPVYFPSALLALALPLVRRRRPALLPLLALALGLVVLVPLLVRSEGGRQWGPRYLFLVVPVLAVLGGAVLKAAPRAWRLPAWCAAGLLLAFGAWTNLWEGTRYLSETYERRVEPLQVVRDAPVRAVAVARDSIALGLAPLFEHKAFFLTARTSELRTLARGLQAHGERSFLLLCHASYPCGPLDGFPERWALRRAGSEASLVEFVKLHNVDRYVLYEGRLGG